MCMCVHAHVCTCVCMRVCMWVGVCVCVHVIQADLFVMEGLGSDGEAHYVHILMETSRNTQRLQKVISPHITERDTEV